MFFWNFWRLAQSDGVWFVRVGWVVCDTTYKKRLFEFFLREAFTHPAPGAACIPRRCTPAYSSAPGRTAHHRQQGRPCQTWRTGTRPDAGHAAPVCTRYQTGHAGQIVPAAGAGGRGVCPKLRIFEQLPFGFQRLLKAAGRRQLRHLSLEKTPEATYFLGKGAQRLSNPLCGIW